MELQEHVVFSTLLKILHIITTYCRFIEKLLFELFLLYPYDWNLTLCDFYLKAHNDANITCSRLCIKHSGAVNQTTAQQGTINTHLKYM